MTSSRHSRSSGAFTGVLKFTTNAITDDGMYTAVVQGEYLQTMPPGAAGPAGDDEADASSTAEESRPEADADSGREAAPVDRDTLPDGDDEPSPDEREPEVEQAHAGDVGPEVEREPTPADRGGDLL